MTVSLIICTCTRAEKLRRLLDALFQQSPPIYELIIVVGPDSESTVQMLEQWPHAHVRLSCPVRNISISRNIGIKAATGDILAFIDDDAVPANTDWLALLTECFRKDPDSRWGAVTAPVLIRDSQKLEFSKTCCRMNDYGQGIVDNQESEHRPLSNFTFVRVAGGNCAFRSNLLKQIGGFDENYAYFHEETDASIRLYKMGWHTHFAKNATIRHYSRVDDFSNPTQRRPWGTIAKSDVYFCIKNAHDPLCIRIFKTARSLHSRHYYREVVMMKVNGLINTRECVKLKTALHAGWALGLLYGLLSSRKLLATERLKATLCEP